MTNVEFTLEEVCYLESLPAIAHVTSKRITYAHEFQVYCMYWYMRGLRPYQIFSSVGMPLELIGAKRIERCISRWSGDRKLMDEAAAYALSGEKPSIRRECRSTVPRSSKRSGISTIWYPSSRCVTAPSSSRMNRSGDRPIPEAERWHSPSKRNERSSHEEDGQDSPWCES